MFWRGAVGVSVVASTVRSTVGEGVLSESTWTLLQVAPIVYVVAAGCLAPRRSERIQPFTVTLWLLVGVAALSALQAVEPAIVLTRVLPLGLTVLFVIVTKSRRWTTRESLVADVRWVGMLLLAIQIVGLVGYVVGATWAADPHYGRYQGLYFNANYAGIAAGLGLLTLAATRRRRADLAGIGVLAIVLVASGSRGSLVAVLAGLVVLAVLRGTPAAIAVYAWSIAMLVSLSMILGLNIKAYFADFFERVQAASDPTSGRLDIYTVLWARWKESPVFGTGFQTGLVETGSLSDERGIYTVYGHNVYLSSLVELGIVGASVVMAVLVVCFVSARRRDPFAAMFVAVVVYELTESALFGFGNPIALIEWIFIAAFAATGQFKSEPDDIRRPSKGRERSDLDMAL